MSDQNLVYPVAIIQDRFGGAFCGGEWIAVAKFDHKSDDPLFTRLGAVYDVAHDREAMDTFEAKFGETPWVAAGTSPDEAYAALLFSMKNAPND